MAAGSSFELWMLAASLVLGFGYILAASHSAARERGYRWAASARDEVKPPLTGVAARLERALRNFGETFPLFAAALLANLIADHHNAYTMWGAGLYVVGRAIYLPLYGFGVPYIRSLVWNIATLGIFLLIWALVA